MANNNICFRGEVSEMSAAYFVREMESLPPRSSANIYLHTPGGDIYAGGEMVNALRAACKRGCKVSVEVGSLCASMGAALLAAARASGCKAKCHANSEVMFHGCWSIAVGGADELTDQAKAMRDFNECVRRDLRKCGVEDTDDWFAADRNKWLNADELLALGLVDEILEEACADPEDLKDSAVKIAALLNHPNDNTMQDEIETTDAGAGVSPEVAPETMVETGSGDSPSVASSGSGETPAEASGSGDSPAVAPEEPSDEADIEERVTALANQRFAGLQAKHDQMIAGLKSQISSLTNERDDALSRLDAQIAAATSMQADIEKLEHDLAETRDQLAKSESVRATVVASALAGDDETSWSAKYRAAKRNY